MASRELLKRLEALEERIGCADGLPRDALWDYVGTEEYDARRWQVIRESNGGTLLRHAKDGRMVVLPRGCDEGLYC